jgi:hypothetical protein
LKLKVGDEIKTFFAASFVAVASNHSTKLQQLDEAQE